MDRKRRRIIMAAGGLLAAATSTAPAALLTPRQSAGPFYPAATGNHCTVFALRSGNVTPTDGTGIRATRVTARSTGVFRDSATQLPMLWVVIAF